MPPTGQFLHAPVKGLPFRVRQRVVLHAFPPAVRKASSAKVTKTLYILKSVHAILLSKNLVAQLQLSKGQLETSNGKHYPRSVRLTIHNETLGLPCIIKKAIN